MVITFCTIEEGKLKEYIRQHREEAHQQGETAARKQMLAEAEAAAASIDKATAEAHESGRKQGYEECATSPCECDGQALRRQGFHEGEADKAAAVQAEHEQTRKDAQDGYVLWNTSQRAEAAATLAISRYCREQYAARTNPPPDDVVDMVLIEMPRCVWDHVEGTFERMTLLDPQPDTSSKETPASA